MSSAPISWQGVILLHPDSGASHSLPQISKIPDHVESMKVSIPSTFICLYYCCNMCVLSQWLKVAGYLTASHFYRLGITASIAKSMLLWRFWGFLVGMTLREACVLVASRNSSLLLGREDDAGYGRAYKWNISLKERCLFCRSSYHRLLTLQDISPES
jgi:hypothetical protein